MKGEDILNAIGGVDADILEKNSGEKLARKRRWLPAVAACLALVLIFGLLAGSAGVQETGCYMPTLRQEGEVPDAGGKLSLVGHHVGFHSGFVVTARAVERLAGVYETPALYGSMTVERVCIYKMRVLKSLDTGLPGVFYYAIPEKYDEDLTKYETLLISMHQRGVDYQLIHGDTGKLVTFSNLFYESWPFYGDIIAFRNGVFDVSLWKCENWIHAPYSVYRFMTRYGIPELLVSEGTTLEEALKKVQERRENGNFTPQVYYDNPLTGEAASAMLKIRLSAPGTYIGSPRRGLNDYGGKRVYYTRYINGYPTNEYIMIDRENNKVDYSFDSFTAEDLQDLPDIGDYIQNLDMDTLSPPNKDVTGRTLLCRVVYGWYEKTENGVETLVKVAWTYQGDKGYKIVDQMFIRLTNGEEEILDREEMKALIGDCDILDALPPDWYSVMYL